jgi:Cu+-exporting ATPase
VSVFTQAMVLKPLESTRDFNPVDAVTGKHLDLAKLQATSVSAGTIYTCPMHPQIRRNALGSCPICGMTLEPLTITADSGQNPELADMSRRFWIGQVLAAPVFILEMGGHIPGLGLHKLVPPLISTWIQFAHI